MNSPTKELYAAAVSTLMDKAPADVYYAELPPEGTAYPFIYVGDTREIQDFRVKFAYFGQTVLTVHIWHNRPAERGALEDLMFKVRRVIQMIIETSEYGWCAAGVSAQIVPDNTTDEPLSHAVLEFTFKHWRRTK